MFLYSCLQLQLQLRLLLQHLSLNNKLLPAKQQRHLKLHRPAQNSQLPQMLQQQLPYLQLCRALSVLGVKIP
jgi:hypothetical protein